MKLGILNKNYLGSSVVDSVVDSVDSLDRSLFCSARLELIWDINNCSKHGWEKQCTPPVSVAYTVKPMG